MYDMSTLTLRIPESLDAELARQCEELGVSKSDFAREALRRHLATREFRRLRGALDGLKCSAACPRSRRVMRPQLRLCPPSTTQV